QQREGSHKPFHPVHRVPPPADDSPLRRPSPRRGYSRHKSRGATIGRREARDQAESSRDLRPSLAPRALPAARPPGGPLWPRAGSQQQNGSWSTAKLFMITADARWTEYPFGTALHGGWRASRWARGALSSVTGGQGRSADQAHAQRGDCRALQDGAGHDNAV